MMKRVVARGTLALIAAGVLAWLGVMERDARLQSRAQRVLLQDAAYLAAVRGPGALARTDADLRRARLLNPDTTPDVYRAGLYRARGDWRRAAAVAKKVLSREPDNLSAWTQLLSDVRGHDPAATRRAQAANRRLDPLDMGG
jgi:hypothetical protein